MEFQHIRLDDLTIIQPGQETPFKLDYASLSASVNQDVFNLYALNVTHPDYSIDGKGHIQLKDDFPVEANIQWATSLEDMEALQGVADISGNLDALDVDAYLQQPRGLNFRGSLKDFLTDFHWQGVVEIKELNLAQFKQTLPEIPINGKAQVSGALATISLDGQFSSNLPEVGAVTSDVVLLWTENRLSIHQAELVQESTQARLQVEGGLQIRDGQVIFNARSEWQGFEWNLSPNDKVFSEKGLVHVEGTIDDYQFKIEEGRFRYHQLVADHIQAEGRGDLKTLSIKQLKASVFQGQIAANGGLNWEEGIRWTADLQGSELDIGSVWPDWPSDLALVLHSEGQNKNAQTQVSMDVRSLKGQLRGEKLQAKARGEMSPGLYRIQGLEAQLGQSEYQLDARFGQDWDVEWKIRDADLGLFYPDAKGSLSSQGQLTGPGEKPRIRASVDARDLALEIEQDSQSLRNLQANIDLDLAGRQHSEVRLQADDLKLNDQAIESVVLELQGTKDANTAELKINRKEESLLLNLEGRSEQQQWSGQVSKADIKTLIAGDWTLAAPASLVVSLKEIQLSAACWQQEDARFCTDARANREFQWSADITLDQAPLALLHPLFRDEMQLDGRVSGSASLKARANKIKDARVDLGLGAGGVRIQSAKKNYPVIDYRSARIQVEHSCQSLDARLKVDISDEEELSGDFQLPPLGCEWDAALKKPIRGRADINLKDLDVIRMFYPELGEISGELVAHLILAGSPQRPEFSGQAELRDGLAEVPALGITLKDANVQLSKVDNEHIRLQGKIYSGDSFLELDGGMHLAPEKGWPASLRIRGEDFQLANLEELQAWVSPDIQIRTRARRMDITGEVFIPKVSMKSFTPPGSVTISNDVVFVDVAPEEQGRRRSTRWQIYSNVKLIFGDDVTFDGYGLRGKVAGNLIVIDEPGKGTVGQGALHIKEGKFRAFGVGLNIDIGRIIFAGGPVNDPGLSVRASRSYDDVTVGVNVQGRLRSPEISTFSTPYMPESEAMSYLMFGKARTDYSFALGDPSTTDTNNGGVDLGNLLSPGYYVDYIVGAFNPTSVMRIRFDITDHIEIRAESAPTYQAGDIIYKFER